MKNEKIVKYFGRKKILNVLDVKSIRIIQQGKEPW